MHGETLATPPTEYTSVGMGMLVEIIGSYQAKETSLGYTYKYYIDTLYKNDNIKMLNIDGIAPTPENLRSGAYPFTAAYYAVMRGGEEDGTAAKFLHWMLSEEGQRVIGQAGYIPVLDVH